VAFLVACKSTNGVVFALRGHRWLRDLPAAPPSPSTPFANAMALWTLSTAGIPPDDPRVAGAWSELKKEAARMSAGAKDDDEDVGTQEAALTLRALVAAKDDPQGERIQGLVARVLKGQRSNGLWARTLGSKEPGDEFDTLFAVESLFLAQRAGAKVPRTVWDRVLAAANKSSGTLRTHRRRGSFVTSSDVASTAALIVLAKAGAEPQKVFTRQELLSIAGVQRALAWLDRHADPTADRTIEDGVLLPERSDRSFSAWLYSAQRLGQLLNLERIGGRAWYVDGTRHLLKVQLSDGAFEELGPQPLNGPLRATSCAILFLLRATPSVTAPDEAR
jgi:hypothetical protein